LTGCFRKLTKCRGVFCCRPSILTHGGGSRHRGLGIITHCYRSIACRLCTISASIRTVTPNGDGTFTGRVASLPQGDRIGRTGICGGPQRQSPDPRRLRRRAQSYAVPAIGGGCDPAERGWLSVRRRTDRDIAICLRRVVDGGRIGARGYRSIANCLAASPGGCTAKPAGLAANPGSRAVRPASFALIAARCAALSGCFTVKTGGSTSSSAGGAQISDCCTGRSACRAVKAASNTVVAAGCARGP